MKKPKFKVVFGWGKDQFYTVRASELPKLYMMFLTKEGHTILKSGDALRGQDIMTITEDWNATMGWNKNYQMRNGDYEEVPKEMIKQARQIKEQSKDIAYYLIDTNQQDKVSLPQEQLLQLLPQKQLML